MKKLGLTPVAGTKNRVFVQPLAKEEKRTVSGLFIPSTAEDVTNLRGVVLAVSTRDENGIEPTVKAGDKVIYSRYVTTEEEHEGVSFFVMKEGDIFAIIN